MKKQKKANLYH